MYTTILMPTDGSKCSEMAIKEGLKLAKAVSAKVSFLYIVEDPIRSIYIAPEIATYQPDLYESVKRVGEEALQVAMQMAEAQGVKASSQLVEREAPVDAIIEAEKDADLLVIGTHGRRGFNRFMFGSVTEGVIRRSSKPCLIVRSSEETN
ncbi:MAG: universal stress protein [Trueperaceae bacterium]|nr:universal stress protein [Trueperaceae bacterium]